MLDINSIPSFFLIPKGLTKTAIATAIIVATTAGFSHHTSAATVRLTPSSTSGTEGDTLSLSTSISIQANEISGGDGEVSTCFVNGDILVAATDSSATEGDDFTLSSTRFRVAIPTIMSSTGGTFSSSLSPIDINLIDDNETEGSEMFVLSAQNIRFSCAFFGEAINTVDTTITINDSEAPTPEPEPEGPDEEPDLTISPQTRQIITSMGDLSLEGVRVQTQNLSKQLRRLRNGLRGNDLSSLSLNIDGQSLSGNDLKQLLGAGAGDEALNNPLGTFIGGSVQIGEEDGENVDYDFNVNSLFFGADYRLNSNVIIGGAIGYTNSLSEISGEDSESALKGYSIAGFSSYYYKDVYYVDGIISYGVSDYETQRQFGSGTSKGVAKGETDGSEFSLALNTGYYLRHKQHFFQVFGALNYITADIDGYQEAYDSGSTSGTLLIIDDQTQKSLTSNIGIEYGRNFNTQSAVITPQVSLDWERQYEDGAETISGRFLGSTTAFAIDDDKQDQSYFNLGLSISAAFAGGLSGYTSYEVDLERDDFDVYDISFGLRWEL